jgi:hypothetical protein
MADLPHVDEHLISLNAGAEETWEALLETADASMASRRAALGARLLGCEDVAASGPRPLALGSTIPGFHVELADRPNELALRGRHRFTRYALIFRLDADGDALTRLRAETRAEFPGMTGGAYRAIVIGSGLHVVATRRLLAAIKRRAERSVGK